MLPETTPQSSVAALPNFADVVVKVEPSVVAITTESVTYDSYNNNHIEQGAGSGWVMDENGTIVTNNHVVEGATTVTVEFSDHKAYTASDITTDPMTDIATLKVNRGSKSKPLVIGDTSRLRVGDWVMVMGNPLGLGISAKQGIISRLGVTMSSSPDQVYTNLIETSAAINRGNSGGPMVNMRGEVIGITSLKIDATGIEGMGYAITVGDVIPVIQTLATGRQYMRPWLGANLATIDNGLAVRYGLPIEGGALVVSTYPGSPAEKVGLIRGDIIISFNSRTVTNAGDLDRLVNSSKVGQEVKLDFWRGKDRKQLT
jgi:serine protease Do